MATVLIRESLQEKLRLVRADRYAAQAAARKALPSERVAKCLRMVNNASQVEVWKHLKTEKSFYNGLLVCGSVWNCPICAAKISERRKTELQQAFDVHKQEGGKIALLTLTFSHKKTDRLKDTMKAFSAATAKFRTGKRYQKIREKMGLIGSIRVFEITYGKNGFHPHTHIALFYKNDINLLPVQKEMFELWEKACNKNGLTVLEGIALDLQDGQAADEYLSKHGTWSLEQELSKAHIKQAKHESLTPFDFLREYLKTEDKKYLNLFKEYAAALKGKTQIYWSRGLKSQFLIIEKSDEEISKEKLEDADLLGLLDFNTWKYIRKNEIRAQFLDWCEKYGFDLAYEILKNRMKKESSRAEDSQGLEI